MDVPADTLWTVTQVADHLSVSRSTVWRWARDGKIHFKSIAGRKFIPVEEIMTMFIVRGRSIPGEIGARPHFERFAPVPWDWERNLTSDEVGRAQIALAAVLKAGGAPVNPAGLAPTIRGERPVEPLFWRYLTKGLENLLQPPKAWTPSDEEIAEAKAIAAREGIGFWEAFMKTEPKDKSKDKL